ncbi:MAG TPA: PAS domain S-box protein [Anaerolineales bacterium]|nr:PAS domain S-box protein [Anaerolineales bacterium]
MDEDIHILIVEDILDDANRVMQEVRKSIPGCQFEHAINEETFQSICNRFSPDLVFLDHQVTGFTTLEAFKSVKKSWPLTPCIVYARSFDEENAVEYIKAGAANYVTQNNAKRLGLAALKALEEKKELIEQSRVEQAMLESEEKFRSLIEQSSDGIVMIDEHGMIIEWNSAESAITGIPRERAMGAPFWEIQYEILTPERRAQISPEEFKSHYFEVVRSGNPELINKKFEIDFMTAQGEIRVLHQSSFIVTSQNGSRIGAIIRDVTEKKHAEERLQRDRQILHEAQVMAKLGSWSVDLRTGEFNIDSECGTIAGCPPGSRDLSEILSLVHPEDLENARSAWQMLQQEGAPADLQLRITSNGKIKWLRIKAKLSAAKNDIPMSAIGVIQDITDTKTAEQILHKSEIRLATVFRVSPISMAITRMKDNCLMDVNEAWEEITGYRKEEVIGRSVLEINSWADAAERQQLVTLLRNRRNVQNFEFKLRHRSGEIRQLLMSAELLDLAGEECMITLALDITERKKTEYALQASEERFHKAFYSGPVGLAITRASNSTYIDANEAFSNIVGFSREELLNQTSLGLGITTAKQKDEYVKLIREQGYIRDKEMELRHSSGEYRTVLGSMEVIELNHEACILSTAIDITERKKVDKHLKESEENYRTLFQNAQVGMFRSRLDGSEILAANPKFCEIFKYSEKELLSMPSLPLWAYPDTRPQKIEELLRKKVIRDYEIEIRTKDGEIRTCLLSAQYFPEKEYLEGSIMDITSRKQAEDWISRLNHQLESILNSAGEGIYGTDSQGRVTFINPTMARMIGWEVVDLLGRPIHPICHHTRPNGSPYPEVECPVYQAFHDGIARHSIVDHYWHKNGLPIPIEHTVTPIREGDKLIGTVVVVSDITKRLQTENETHQHMVEMEMLYESGLALSQLLSPEEIGQKIIELLERKMDWHHTAIRLYNPENDTLKLLAFSQPNTTNKDEHVAVKHQFNNKITKSSDGVSGWAVKNTQVVRHGDISNDPRYIETYHGINSGLYVPVRLGDNVLGVISIESEKPNAFSEKDERLVVTLANQAAVAFENARLFQTAQQEIIERKKVEQLLAEERNQLAQHVQERTADLSNANMDLARAMRVKDEFLASMSHELRTPLTGILGFSEALQLNAYGELSEKQLKPIKAIEDSGRHLLSLINDILDLSKIEAGKLELQFATCSITDVCTASLQIVKGMAQHKRQTIHYSPTNQPVAIFVDARRIKQVLVNLLSNAVKFTPEGGELGLDVEVSAKEQVARLAIWDKGIGIKPEDLPKLFKPFTQIDSSLAREYSGTGLGLSLAQRLIELHNGKITVESSPGQGSRFTVTIPWSEQNDAQLEQTADQKNSLFSQVKSEDSSPAVIMIADDNVAILNLLEDFLTPRNYKIAKAHSGLELLERITESHPDLLLMDIQMPGMDGLETIRHIRSHANPKIATTPIIAITALAMPGDRERCLQAGADEYMSKPLKLYELSIIIKKYIRKSK